MYSAVLHDSITCAYIQFWLAIKKTNKQKNRKKRSMPWQGVAMQD